MFEELEKEGYEVHINFPFTFTIFIVMMELSMHAQLPEPSISLSHPPSQSVGAERNLLHAASAQSSSYGTPSGQQQTGTVCNLEA
jgi:hypothetical protein